MNANVKITFLGTGTSQGVPLINCSCAVCTSADPRNKRLRCSVMIEVSGYHLLVDTSMDMRQQFLTHPFPKIDAVLFTHAHADHIFGLDELRRFNYLQKQIIPVYGNHETMGHLRRIFGYAFDHEVVQYGIPNIEAHEIDGPWCIGTVPVIPVPLRHGEDNVLGFRIGRFAYCTDVNFIPPSSYDLLGDLDILVLDALRETKHSKHFSLTEAIAEAQKIGARHTYFTHISHILDHERHGKILPENCQFAYDGLVLECAAGDVDLQINRKQNQEIYE